MGLLGSVVIVLVASAWIFVPSQGQITECLSLDNASNEKFELLYEWSYLNYTWPDNNNPKGRGKNVNQQELLAAKEAAKVYKPGAAAPAGVKYHSDRLYLAIPRTSRHSPVTLAWVTQLPSELTETNPLLTPYPGWAMNQLAGTSSEAECRALQNVHSMEIDRKGIMWVLDGRRWDGTTPCPPKIVLLDLNRGGAVVGMHVLPSKVCSRTHCFLNDIVVDELDGGWAYMTDTDEKDPGLVIYSRQRGRSWKIRHETFKAEEAALNFLARGVRHNRPTPVDGIAMAPAVNLDDAHRYVYYTALTGLTMFGIDSAVLRNEQLATSKDVSKHIIKIGPKLGPSDGMVVDSVGRLYYGLLVEDAVATWDINKPINTSKIIDVNHKLIAWPDSFGFDTFGTLYLLATEMGRFLQGKTIPDEINFRLLRLYTATCSYQF